MRKLLLPLVLMTALTGCGQANGLGVAAAPKGGLNASSLYTVDLVVRESLRFTFDARDLDRSGDLSFAELPSFDLFGWTTPTGDPEADKKALMAAIDRNGDGRATRLEFTRPDLRQPLVANFRGMVRMAFDAKDADHDGRLTPEEFKTGAAFSFEQADRNQNGKLDFAELEQAFVTAAQAELQKPAPAEPPATLGLVRSLDLVAQAVDQAFEGIFKRLDRDASGFVETNEVAGNPAPSLRIGEAEMVPALNGAAGRGLTFEQIDADHDGKVSHAEYTEPEHRRDVLVRLRIWFGKQFSLLDRDGDRSLSPAELQGTGLPFALADADRNGGVIFSEYENAYVAVKLRF